ncbi:MAG TPA: hypothetical protein VM390_04850 [Acidimicrobiales bacterium]|jgi:hypothetical protein|nr:hypothetical protein [Acidimicrobiales bacterium]
MEQAGVCRPPSLAVFLDCGGDLAAFPGIEGLSEAVVVRRRLNCPAENAAHGAFLGACVERWLADGPAALVATTAFGCVADQAMVTAFAWAAECYADPALAERFERAMPVELWLEDIQWATERKAGLTA